MELGAMVVRDIGPIDSNMLPSDISMERFKDLPI